MYIHNILFFNPNTSKSILWTRNRIWYCGNHNFTFVKYNIGLSCNFLFTNQKIYIKIKKLEKVTEYKHSFLEKTLIYIVLRNNGIKEFLFDVEKLCFKPDTSISNDEDNFFITGLARSGTTKALNIFYNSNLFATLTYDDFPFILSPNLFLKFKKIFKKYNTKIFRRAHDDGLNITNSSPEAFDEIFWKMELNNKYIDNDFLNKHLLTNESINNYRILISLIKKKSNKKKFISKNNNLILRTDSFLNNFKKSKILVFFRNPFFHANSLLNQHINFLEIQKKNKYIKNYMNYLGHHEFGENFKVFNIGKVEEINPLNLNFWLEKWINYYTYILNFKLYKNIEFICYEELCKYKTDYLKLKISDKVVNKLNFNSYLNKNDDSFKIQNSKYLDKAYSIYKDLINS